MVPGSQRQIATQKFLKYPPPLSPRGRSLPLTKTTSVNVEPGIRCSARKCQHFSVYPAQFGSYCIPWSLAFRLPNHVARYVWMTKPHRLHTMAWSSSKTSPHVQVDGVSLICQSYLKGMASLNFPLFRVKSTSVTGMTQASSFLCSKVGASLS